eukprot:TRINITY_DN1218_c0_g2_i1.p1 TRINITY_DN1218_c0_g2~~TRINITY_DN1218_c0_g2_i1.p1  ORF type:complete len:1072 (+),score=216.69 TRINITY_DN1218_c0_g2_i1:53-3217(+)
MWNNDAGWGEWAPSALGSWGAGSGNSGWDWSGNWGWGTGSWGKGKGGNSSRVRGKAGKQNGRKANSEKDKDWRGLGGPGENTSATVTINGSAHESGRKGADLEAISLPSDACLGKVEAHEEAVAIDSQNWHASSRQVVSRALTETRAAEASVPVAPSSTPNSDATAGIINVPATLVLHGRTNPLLSENVRKLLLSHDATLEMEDLGHALTAFQQSYRAGEGICDLQALTMLLSSLAKANKLGACQDVIDAVVTEKVFLDPAAIIAIALSVSQRSQSHKALRFLRRLIYECIPEDFTNEQIQFFDRHMSFIFSELMAEAAGCFFRIENRDMRTLVSRGHCELGIEMDWKSSSGTSFVLYNRVEIEDNTDEKKPKACYTATVPGYGFQRTDGGLLSLDISQADMLKLVPKDYSLLRDGAEVEVTSAPVGPESKAALTVKLRSPPKIPFQPGMVYRLDRLAGTDQTRRMLEALQVVVRKRSNKILSKATGNENQMLPNSVLQDLILTPVDQILSKAGKSDLPLQTVDVSASKAKQEGLTQFQQESKHVFNHLLNASQIDALRLSGTRRLTLIQGPPGTGKTTTAVQIVAAMVRYGLVDLPILVSADSNTAVDNLVKGIAKAGVNVVRVGRPEAIREDVKIYALEGRWKELKKAEVVAATCIGASGSALDKAKFPTVLIDECTQASETAALVPLARGCQQAILIGDQCQLPPTVLSDLAETEGLGESLFTRLVTQGVTPQLLDIQYRMHPLVAEFASAAFYNGRLQNGVSHLNRKPPEGFPWPQKHMPVAFINMEQVEERREDAGSSYINTAEAEKTMWALLEVCKSGKIGPSDIGVVTPYKGQVRLLRKLIRERPGLAKFRSGLEVESVDRFQGQEKEVIIFCAVRNNREGKVGFLCDWRRLNVMLTRARIGLIVIGSRNTLQHDPLWHEWLLWAQARGAVCGESARGTWVPRYLVDDRDGIWTVKAEILEGVPPLKSQALPNAHSKETVEVADSWEDIDSEEEASEVLEMRASSSAETADAEDRIDAKTHKLRISQRQQAYARLGILDDIEAEKRM